MGRAGRPPAWDGGIPARVPAISVGLRTRSRLPDPKCSPGAVTPGSQPRIWVPRCAGKGGTRPVSGPPEAMTEAAKKKIMAAYGIPWSEASKYELDHEIELAAGGASDVRNLWPEPNTFVSGQAKESSFVHNDKDQVEANIFDALCTGKTDLVKAQQAMATDWTTAETTLGLTARKP